MAESRAIKTDEKLAELRAEMKQLQNRLEYQRNATKNIQLKKERVRYLLSDLLSDHSDASIDWETEMNDFNSLKAEIEEYNNSEIGFTERLKTLNSEYEKLLKELKKSHSERESKMKKDDTVFHEELKEFMADTERSIAAKESQVNSLRQKLEDEESQVKLLEMTIAESDDVDGEYEKLLVEIKILRKEANQSSDDDENEYIFFVE